jgi:hypothetical protein
MSRCGRCRERGVLHARSLQETGVARATSYRYLSAASFPERLPRQHERPIEPSIPYLHERWNAGQHNALTLWREIRAQGYPAGVAQVRRLVMAWRAPRPAPGSPGTRSLPRRKRSPTQYAKRAGSSPSPRPTSQRVKRAILPY